MTLRHKFPDTTHQRHYLNGGCLTFAVELRSRLSAAGIRPAVLIALKEVSGNESLCHHAMVDVGTYLIDIRGAFLREDLVSITAGMRSDLKDSRITISRSGAAQISSLLGRPLPTPSERIRAGQEIHRLNIVGKVLELLAKPVADPSVYDSTPGL